MTSGYPIHDQIHVLKAEESLGPFSIDEILDGLEDGVFDLNDVCLRVGAIDTERIRDIIDWEENSFPTEQSEQRESRHFPSPFDEGAPREEHEEEDLVEPVSPDASAPPSTLYAGHPSILTYPLSVLGVVGGAVGAIWLFSFDLWLSLSCLAVCGISLTYLTYLRFTRDFLITTRRVEVISGLIARSSNEIRIVDIRAINVTCRGISGLFGIGTVDFFTTGDDPEVRFENVWAAKDIKQLVRNIQDQNH